MVIVRAVLSSCSFGLVLAAWAASTPAQLVFHPPQTTTFAPGEMAVRVGAGDVDGDGIADLVSISGGAPTLHLGIGGSGFLAGTPVPGGVTGDNVGLADLDGDQDADLMVVSDARETLDVLLADGAGGFGPPANFVLGGSTTAYEVVSRDVDDDGDPDVVTVASDDIRFFLNDGTGTLSAGPTKTDFGAGFPFIGAHPASLNGDGLPDLIISKGVPSDPRSSIYLGEPGGGFDFQVTLPDAAVHAVGDLDADGDLDLIETSHQLLQPVVVRSHLNAGDGSFTAGPATNLQFLVAFGTDLDLQDLDADGRADLVVVNSDDFTPPGPEAWLLPGDGTGAFAMPGARVTLATTMTTTQAWVGPCADYDADGRLDVSALVAPLGATRLSVSLNLTYPARGPLQDLGGQLSSTATGYPVQLVQGPVVGGQLVGFTLLAGPVQGFVYLVAGLSVLEAPFKGGTMVPQPQLVMGPFITDTEGTVSPTVTWPFNVPSGLQLVTQYWFPAPAVAGFAATSGAMVTAP